MARLTLGARRRATSGGARRLGLKAGVVAATATVAFGAGLAAAPAPQAQAKVVPGTGIDLPSWSGLQGNPVSVLGAVVGGLLNNPVAQTVAEQWRIELCASGATSKQGMADCTQATGTGIAMVVPGSVELVPVVVYNPLHKGTVPLTDFINWMGIGVKPLLNGADTPLGSAKVVGDGFQFALAQTGGKATAISYLPLSLATAGASGGRTAVSFAVIGMANAWTTDATPIKVLDKPIVTLPGIKSTSCFGIVTAAYAEDAGACLNLLGTFDSKLDVTKKLPELQLGLTNPVGALMNPQDVLTEFVGNVFGGQPFNPATLFTDDVARLSFGGDNLVTLTSDYGLQKLSNGDGAVALSWLGGTVYLLPTAKVNGKNAANALGLPVVQLDGLGDLSQVIPTLKTGKFRTPLLGSELDGIDTEQLTSSLGTQTLNADSTAPQQRSTFGAKVDDSSSLSIPDAPAPQTETSSSNVTSSLDDIG